MNGWIKLWRKTLESDMYQSLNSVQRDVMITCLLLANHTGKEWEWKGKVFEAEPGQFITSLQSLKERCAKDVSIQNIRTALNKLESWEFLTSESTKTGRLVTVVNWATYQHTEEKLTKEPTESQQTANKQLTTTKNDKRSLKKNIPQAQAIITGKSDERTPAQKQVNYFSKRYKQKYEREYYVRLARQDKPSDSAIMENLVEQLGEQEVGELVDYFFDTWLDADEFSRSNPTISMFESQIHKIYDYQESGQRGFTAEDVIV